MQLPGGRFFLPPFFHHMKIKASKRILMSLLTVANNKLGISGKVKMLTIIFAVTVNFSRAQVSLTCGDLIVKLSKQGSFLELINKKTGKDYLYHDSASVLLQVVSGSERLSPTSLIFHPSEQKISLQFKQAGISVDVLVRNKNTHIVFEIVKAI